MSTPERWRSVRPLGPHRDLVRRTDGTPGDCERLVVHAVSGAAAARLATELDILATRVADAAPTMLEALDIEAAVVVTTRRVGRSWADASPTERAAAVEAAARAVRDAHEAGIVHGAVSTDALVFGPDGPRLGGFGVARATGGSPTTDDDLRDLAALPEVLSAIPPNHPTARTQRAENTPLRPRSSLEAPPRRRRVAAGLVLAGISLLIAAPLGAWLDRADPGAPVVAAN